MKKISHNMTESELLQLNYKILAQKEKAHFRRNRNTALLFMLPAIILVSLLLLYPAVFNIVNSFTKWWKTFGFMEFDGIEQYKALVSNSYLPIVIKNTLLWILVSLIVPVTLGLFLAVVCRGIFFEKIIISTIFLPKVLAPTAAGVFWFYIYAPNGMLNFVLEPFIPSVHNFGWLYKDSTVTGSIIITYLWQTVGVAMVLISLGLAAIPKDPIEAAKIDGASPWKIFVYVIFPQLLPTLLVIVILSVLAGFTVFDQIWVMAKSYPDKRFLSLTTYMFVEAFEKSSWAYSSAIAVVLGVVVLSVTWLQAVLQEKIERLIK